jgi:hypothetical protein
MNEYSLAKLQHVLVFKAQIDLGRCETYENHSSPSETNSFAGIFYAISFYY